MLKGEVAMAFDPFGKLAGYVVLLLRILLQVVNLGGDLVIEGREDEFFPVGSQPDQPLLPFRPMLSVGAFEISRSRGDAGPAPDGGIEISPIDTLRGFHI